MKHHSLIFAGLCLAGLTYGVVAQEQENSDKKTDSEKRKPEFREKEDFKGRRFGPHEGGPGGPDFRPIPHELIEKFDTDKDGKLNPEEFRAAQEELRNAHKEETLKRFDKNGDGKLSDSEIEKMKDARDEEIKREVIKEYDANGNGRLDSAEKAKLKEDAKLEPGRFFWYHQPGPHPLKELVK